MKSRKSRTACPCSRDLNTCNAALYTCSGAIARGVWASRGRSSGGGAGVVTVGGAGAAAVGGGAGRGDRGRRRCGDGRQGRRHPARRCHDGRRCHDRRRWSHGRHREGVHASTGVADRAICGVEALTESRDFIGGGFWHGPGSRSSERRIDWTSGARRARSLVVESFAVRTAASSARSLATSSSSPRHPAPASATGREDR